jgi:hypothetical protein
MATKANNRTFIGFHSVKLSSPFAIKSIIRKISRAIATTNLQQLNVV